MFEECEKITTSPAATQLLDLAAEVVKAKAELARLIGEDGLVTKALEKTGVSGEAQKYLDQALPHSKAIPDLVAQIDLIPITADLLNELLFVMEVGDLPLGEEQFIKVKSLQGWNYKTVCEATKILLSRKEAWRVFDREDKYSGFIFFDDGRVAVSIMGSTKNVAFAAPWLDALVGNEFNLNSFKHQGLRYIEFQEKVQEIRPFLEKARL